MDGAQKVRHLDRGLGRVGALVVLRARPSKCLLSVLGRQHSKSDRNTCIELHLHNSGRSLTGDHLEVVGLASDDTAQAHDCVVAALLRQRQRRYGKLKGARHPVDVGILHAALFEDLEATLDAVLARIPRGTLARRMLHVSDAFFDYYERSPSLSRTLLRQSLFAGGPWAKRFAGQLAK